MLLSRYPKHEMLMAIVGPTVSCSIFFMLAINYIRDENTFSCVLMVSMGLIALHLVIKGYKKALKALPSPGA